MSDTTQQSTQPPAPKLRKVITVAVTALVIIAAGIGGFLLGSGSSGVVVSPKASMSLHGSSCSM